MSAKPAAQNLDRKDSDGSNDALSGIPEPKPVRMTSRRAFAHLFQPSKIQDSYNDLEAPNASRVENDTMKELKETQSRFGVAGNRTKSQEIMDKDGEGDSHDTAEAGPPSLPPRQETSAAPVRQTAKAHGVADSYNVVMKQLFDSASAQIAEALEMDNSSRTQEGILGLGPESQIYQCLDQLVRFACRQRTPPLPDAVTSKEWQGLLDRLTVCLSMEFQKSRDWTKQQTRPKVEDVVTGVLESVEQQLMELTYPVLFSPPPGSSDVRAKDEALSSRIAALNLAGMRLSHLGINVGPEAKTLVDSSVIEIGKSKWQNLQEMVVQTSPLKKLKKVVDAHTQVVECIDSWNKRISSGTDEPEAGKTGGGAGGAGALSFSMDTILPVLIYTVIKTNPPKFVSNIRYIENYRYHQLLEAQYSYCLTNMDAIIEFLESVDIDQFGLDGELATKVQNEKLGEIKKQVPVVPFVMGVGNFGRDLMFSVVGGVAEGTTRVASNVYDV
ncbi:hypothetical protein EV182_000955 [Spiromyces aspiralis]|uniref:Uncharacterized protein n=1 Tax=Spiromyces aspiralis TaxID=68401 RepID=A0ACC1HHT8_9FUNG|nr:hypothetical protein EV182_000955 [Spiromyces aspiralis]